MTTETTKTEQAHTNGHDSGPDHSGHDVLALAGAAVDQARDAVLMVRDSVPPIVEASRGFLAASTHAIERASDERISAGTTLSLGLAIGLLVGGAPRLLTAAALVPVAAMSLALLDRRTARTARSASAA
jgi:hypothetical protein